MIPSKILTSRFTLLCVTLLALFTLLFYVSVYTQVGTRDSITEIVGWSRDITVQLEERRYSPNTTSIIHSNSQPVTVYENGKRISLQPRQTEYNYKPKVYPVASTQEHCPYYPRDANYLTHRNLSLRHPKELLEYSPPDDYPAVVILTPVSNAASHLNRYFGHVCSLTYPHKKISLILGEDSSQDTTVVDVHRHLESIQPYFRAVKLFNLQGTTNPWPNMYRHDEAYQKNRRAHMARSRNQLLSAGLRDETWVLWLDCDVTYIPPDLIEQLISAKQEIVTPACMYRKKDGTSDVYDKNTWRETEESLNFLRVRPKDFLMLEGYNPTKRLYLNGLRDGRRVVPIDGVGGCVLLIKATVHRNGLIFPPYVYEHEIETEGLARMAQDMGYKVYGMPYLEVYH